MNTLSKIKETEDFKGLIPSEYKEDDDYQDNMLIEDIDMRGILIEANISSIDLMVGLNEQGNGDYWNELRQYKDGVVTILDHDAPNSLTAKEWAVYLDNLTK